MAHAAVALCSADSRGRCSERFFHLNSSVFGASALSTDFDARSAIDRRRTNAAPLEVEDRERQREDGTRAGREERSTSVAGSHL